MDTNGADCEIPQNCCAPQPEYMDHRKESLPTNANVSATSLAGVKVMDLLAVLYGYVKNLTSQAPQR